MSTTFESWDDENLDLNINLLRGVYSYGFEKPSPIQKKAIIPILNKKDVIAQAQSGTGKTGAFTVSVLQSIDPDINSTQAIIMSPTRELSKQIYDVVNSIGYLLKYNTCLMIGGTSIDEQIRECKENPPKIIVGCPGRIFDLLCRRVIDANTVKILAIDEADEMLSYGFKEQIYNILQVLSADMQILLFSATMPQELKDISQKFMRDPVEIYVKQEQLSLQGIKQFYVFLTSEEEKALSLIDIFNTISMTQCIIYCNSVERSEYLHDYMCKENFPVSKIHSKLSHEERREAYSKFKNGDTRVLISTDLFSRGIDVQQVSYVINYDIPKNVNTYLHRIGRSGRWGRKGVAINFITKYDKHKLNEIERFYHTVVDELPMNFSSFLGSG
jgi:translation initiation factor 4A